ncbi:MAG TPA: ABC transporter permease [Thermomicrobiales bacterium]|nr:ABC transporter permease [Thermomicrobiales bacterium]
MSVVATPYIEPAERNDAALVPARTPTQLAWNRFKQSRLALLGLVILVVLVLLAVLAPWIAPQGQNEIDLFSIKAPPSRAHLLGTDALGRDVVSRLLYGGRMSLAIGIAAAVICAAVGIFFGAIAGYYGGWVDGAIMRYVDLMLAFPSIFLLLIISAMFEGISVWGVILFLALFSWMWLTRIIRAEFLSLKRRDFIEAARAIGVPDRQIILRHLLPNVIGAIVVSFTLDVALFMLAEAGLSFLGFGVPPGIPTWGNMLSESRTAYLTDPLLAILPGLALTIAVLAFNFVGDGLRDAFDPKGSRG